MNFGHLLNSILSYGTKPIINLLASLYLMKIYGPDDFGVAGLYIAFYSLLGMALELGYSNIILQSKDRQLVIGCFLRVGLVSLSYSILSFLVLLFFDLGFQVAAIWYYPVYSVFFAVNMLFRSFWVSRKEFTKIYLAEILPVLFLILLIIAEVAHFYLPHYFLILIGLNSFIYVVLAGMNFRRFKGLSLSFAKPGRENYSYLGQNLINFFTRYFEKQTIFGFYGSEPLGYFNRMQSVIFMPVTMLVSGIHGYFLPRITENISLKKQLVNSMLVLLVLLQLGALLFPGVATFLINRYLDNWSGFISYLKAFAPFIFLIGAYYLVNIILVLNKKVKIQNWLDIVLICGFFLALYIFKWSEFQEFIIYWQVIWFLRLLAALSLVERGLWLKLGLPVVLIAVFNLFISVNYYA